MPEGLASDSEKISVDELTKILSIRISYTNCIRLL